MKVIINKICSIIILFKGIIYNFIFCINWKGVLSKIKKYPNSTDQNYLRAFELDVIKNHLNDLWSEYKEYADKDFEKKLSEDYVARVWEMSLGATLRHNGIDLIKSNKIEGPDLEIDLDGKKIFIEAICPMPGSIGNPDAVKENNIIKNEDDGSYIGFFEKIELDKIELRLSSAIYEKYSKYRKYIEKKIVEDSDPYIIAISSARIPFANYSFGDEMGIEKIILRTILPIGAEKVLISDIKQGNCNPIVEFKKYNTKSNSEKISKNIFMDEKYQDISAIIFTSEQYPFSKNFDNRNIFLIKNPNSKNLLLTDLGLKEIEIKIGKDFYFYKKKNY